MLKLYLKKINFFSTSNVSVKNLQNMRLVSFHWNNILTEWFKDLSDELYWLYIFVNSHNTWLSGLKIKIKQKKKHKYSYKSIHSMFSSVQFSSVAQSCLTLVTPWIAARQASLSITNSRSLLKLMSIESVMPSSHLILCRPLLLLPPIPPSIRVFSNESTLHMRWPRIRVSASTSVLPMNTQDWSLC